MVFIAAFSHFFTDFFSAFFKPCLLYTSDAADDLPCVDLGGRRISKQKKFTIYHQSLPYLNEYRNKLLITTRLLS